MMASSVPKITQLSQLEFRNEGNLISSRDPLQPVLPHLGTYVIDTPRDKNWTWRQQRLIYHETHRGVLPAMKVNPLPDIPKRCDLRTLPDLQEASSGSASESPLASLSPTAASDRDAVPVGRYELSAPRPRIRSLSPLNSTRTKEKRSEQTGEHLMEKTYHGFLTLRPPNRRSRNRELTTSVPYYTSLCTLKEIQTSNLWRAKPIKNEHLGDFRVTPTKQPRVQSKRPGVKIFPYENEVRELGIGSSRLDANGKKGDAHLKLKPLAEKSRGGVDSEADASTRFDPPSPSTTPPVKHIGHTSRHNEWSNTRLAEVLKDRPVPGEVRGNPPGEGRRKMTRSRLGEEEGHRGEGDGVDRSWLHVVNTQLVDKDVYDRYANVKLS